MLSYRKENMGGLVGFFFLYSVLYVNFRVPQNKTALEPNLSSKIRGFVISA